IATCGYRQVWKFIRMIPASIQTLKSKLNIVLMLIFSLLGLYMMEFFLTLRPYISGMTQEKIPQKMNIPFDKRSMLDFTKQLRLRGIDAYPGMLPMRFRSNGIEIDGKLVYPLSEIAEKTIVLCNESGEWITYQSDKYGFNNPADTYEGGR